MDDQPQKKSYKLVWIAGASLAVLVIVVGVTFALVSQTAKKEQIATKKTTTSAKKVASKSDVQNGIDKLSASLKQAATDQAAVKVALEGKPVKVGK